ncbi:molybdate-anion transporter-like isoform X2 [Mercenaria mercenaria]|uniref:molybdate-anion transporter-like isoform X2 n=2 Tax=Mercenaria mercenaria TaxID=6596 RepID=UPI001E1DB630|nr:molybdate-anion transporter-like isoform X2 [Mercenaria mercenaria]XP_045165419.1 molybdate-anion transporter-like isoform X2 [Mercenaria mercenaria]
MNIFLGGFYVLCILCAILFFYTRSKTQAVTDAGFQQFQRTYMIVYLLAMAGDWLQGPHVYALYASYGMTTHQIEILFVAGFGSSMIVGTVVGSFADKYGRRNNCILYGILYGAACITKHFNNFWVLMIGRLLGGTATSILYSAFESWLVFEHNKRGYDSELLGNIFSHAILGNSLVAITAGIVAQYFADMFGFVAPFDVSLTVLMLMCGLVVCTWPENYGDKTIHIGQSMQNAVQAIKSDYKVLCLGLIQSLFEGSMYVFVLEWTPALTPPTPISPPHTARDLLDTEEHTPTIPHGHIFAGFMVSIMIGSSLFKLLSKCTTPESFMRPVLFVSALTLATPILFPGNQLIIFIAFLVFEVCVGLFWPSMSTMRGKYVPEETRATVMNFFRIPLNFIVVLILLQNLKMSVIFSCCVVFLILATVFQHWLYQLSRTRKAEIFKMEPDKEQVV